MDLSDLGHPLRRYREYLSIGIDHHGLAEWTTVTTFGL
jgi:hypothetical protein